MSLVVVVVDMPGLPLPSPLVPAAPAATAVAEHMLQPLQSHRRQCAFLLVTVQYAAQCSTVLSPEKAEVQAAFGGGGG